MTRRTGTSHARGATPGDGARPANVQIEVTGWVTRFVGGDGSGRRVFEEPVGPGTTVRTALRAVAARHPDLAAALWHGNELGEHIEVLVNDAVLGIRHEIDSPLAGGDRIALVGQYMGGR